MPTLFIVQGPDKGLKYQSLDDCAVIGRSSRQVQLSDTSTSRRHAEIRRENGHWVLSDLNSANGTYLNGQRVVKATRLKDGDQILVGATVLVFGGRDANGSLTDEELLKELVDLETGSSGSSPSIVSRVDASRESVILQSPEASDAVVAWSTVYKVAEAIGAIETSHALLERVADILFEELVVDRLLLLMKDPKTRELVPHLVRCHANSRQPLRKIRTSRTIIKHVLNTRDAVLCANAMSDPRFGAEGSQDSLHQMGLCSILCVPIVVRDEIHGIFHMDCTMSRHTYTQAQLRLVVAVARLLGMALENFRLLETKMNTTRLAAVGETVAFLSHHIRNILQGMQGGAEVVELGFRKQNLETAESGWALVRRNLDRTLHFAMNMLTFSKDRQPRVEPAALNPIVEDAISLVRHRAEEKGVAVEAVLVPLPDVPLDADGIHQVIQNILINAIEAAPERTGRVCVQTELRESNEEVVIRITDNGTGIPAEDRERVFDVFHSSKGQGGTGLGLAAAQKIVTELYGRIHLKSEAGQGTIFEICIPVHRTRVVDLDRTQSPS